MDFCGMNPALVPDGTNAYLFGNSVIFVTRWSDMSDEEKKDVETGELSFVVHPYEFVQFSIKIGGRWSDVMVNLHHCYAGFNNENAPVDKAIFIFADTHDSDYIIARNVMLPAFIAKYLGKCNVNSYKKYNIDSFKSVLEQYAKNDPQKDYFDFLYDLNWEQTKDTSRKARRAEPDNVLDGVYVEISANNTVTNMYQHEYKPKEAAMSSEVKLYLDLAEKGIEEGQYNLGVCYETGDGVEQDLEKAVYWYKKAAEQGYFKAQHNLGICYCNGYGCQQNYAEGARLFLLAAEQGDMYSQYNLGVCYYMGNGVEKNIYKATEWFVKAAEQGHPEAKRVLSGK